MKTGRPAQIRLHVHHRARFSFRLLSKRGGVASLPLSKEVTIDGLLDISDRLFSLLVVRVRVLFPSVEACLIAAVVQLAVMD